MDKIVSSVFANKIKYRKEENYYFINFNYKNKAIEVCYYLNNKKFYIHKKYYNYQPHIIPHWNPTENKKDFYGLCLTMDGKDYRTSSLNANDKIQRVKEIIFELWDDPIGERFRELNVMLQTTQDYNLFINKNNEFMNNYNNKIENVLSIKIDFNQKTDGIFFKNLAQDLQKKAQPALISIKYKDDVKKVFFISQLKEIVFCKLNDLTNESLFARTGKYNKIKKVILVGVGSIGGIVLDFLCKNGFENIDIYDDDKFDVVNNTRHIIGADINNLGKNKALALKEHYEKYFPNIKIKAYGYNYDFANSPKINDDYLIFVTTGGSHLQKTRNILNLFKNINKKFLISVIDIFTEPFAMAMHTITCSNNQIESITDLSHFSKNDRYIVTSKKDFRKNFDGCFSPTLPYSFAPLQIGTLMLMIKLLKMDFKDSHLTIPLVSIVNKREILNKEISKEINVNKIKVKQW